MIARDDGTPDFHALRKQSATFKSTARQGRSGLLGCDPQIVRDEQQSEVETQAHLVEKPQHLILHRDIQRRNRLTALARRRRRRCDQMTAGLVR